MHTGIDMGLKVTSIVTLDDSATITFNAQFGTEIQLKFKDKIKAHPCERYELYYDSLYNHFTDNRITGTIVMEQPLGMLLGHGRKLIELKGIYLIALSKLKLDYNKVYLPQPTVIKKFFTGRGDANKQDMIDECIKRGYSPQHHHEADSIAMAHMSLEGAF